MTPSNKSVNPGRLYLVDGSGYIFRAYHALPPLTRSDGTPVNAVLGYCTMLLKLMEDANAENMAVIFDAGRKTFRNEIYPDYKANRDDPPEDLIPQFDLVRQATRACGCPCIEQKGYEADDLIATYARLACEQSLDVTIVSSDKDLMQLVRPGVQMLDPMKNRHIGELEVRERFGVDPDKVVEVQALAGDSSDNVPGVPGIGVKTAALLINEYGDLESVLAHAEDIKQPKRRQNLIENAELARISRELVWLRDDVPVQDKLEDFELCEPAPATLRPFLEEQEFKTLLAKMDSRWAASGIIEIADEALPVQATYELVTDVAILKKWIARAHVCGVVAIDTETTSLSAMRAELVGVSLSTAIGTACYVPVGHVSGGDDPELGAEAPNSQQLAPQQALVALRPLLENFGVLKVGHNIKYDLVVLSQAFAQHCPGELPLMPAAIDDTMLLSYVLDAGVNSHGLDELADRHLNHAPIKYSDVTGTGKSRISFAQVPVERALNYAAEDADLTLRLHGLMKRRLVAEGMVSMYETVERPLVPVIVEMERVGIQVERAALERLSQDFATRMKLLVEQGHNLAGEVFNLGSPKQLGEILFDKMDLPGGKKGKAGAYTTSADVLEDLAAQGHYLPRVVLDWRQLQKLKSTYTDALVEQINPKTGRVHTAYGMAIAQTGRLSSNDPNLQNIPVRTDEGRKIREAFVAPKGRKLVSLDYSQIELRIVAHVAEIDVLRDAFDKGQDIHALTAAQVFGVPLGGLDPLLRQRAKAINFGIIYGISAFGLARNLGITRGEARDYIDAYFERYPGIRDYMERAVDQARAQGFIETLFRRKIHLRGIKDKIPSVRNFAERQAINAPIQGTAADIIKRAMVRMTPALAGLDARMLLQVHDELLFEVAEEDVNATIEIARIVMERAAEPVVKLSVPLVADAGVGQNWAEAH